MAKKVKGLTLEFGVDTTKFNSEINQLTKPLRQIQSVLTEVNKQLKFDPTNVDLLKQRIKILNQETQELARQENILKSKLKDANDEFDKNRSKLNPEQVKQYEQNIAKLTSQLSKTTIQLDDYNKQLDQTEKALDDPSYAMELFGEKLVKVDKSSIAAGVSVGNLQSKLIEFAAQKVIQSVQWIINKIKELKNAADEAAKSFIKTGIEYNREIGSFEATLNAILGGDENAKKQTDGLVKAMQELASSSSFSASALLEASTQIAASGSSAEETQKAVTNLGKALAYAGKGDDELSRMAQNLNQIKNAGKATATDLKQFAYAGVPIYTLLAEYSSEFNKITSDTVVQYEDLVAALSKAGEEGGKFYDAFNIQAGTLNGQITALENNAKLLAGSITQELTQSITSYYLPALNEFLVSLQTAFAQNGMEGVAQGFSAGFQNFLQTIGNEENIDNTLAAAQSIFDIITKAFDGTTEEGQENLKQLEETTKLIGEKLFEFVSKNRQAFVNTGIYIGEAIISGLMNAYNSYFANSPYQDAIDQFNRDMAGQSSIGSGGFGDYNYGKLQSGGFSSGGIATLNANFTINNQGQPIAQDLAYQMVTIINEELGGMV